ncbi:MAG TPA: cytochrome c oxidase assembly protein [Roseiarcus sp.]|nr:cytochrome c oxidase assembly protein [Roseiarcus sp.]
MSLSQEATSRRNRRLALGGGLLALSMIGLTFAAAPFYTAFCRVTGYEGTPQIVKEDATTTGRRTLRVGFDANVAPGLEWRLEPETDAVRVRTGKTITVFFRARNLSDKETAANATYNVTPEVSGAWFDKVQCFCFSTQRLGPHETAEWPVVFFLDPKLETDPSMARVDSITLSYTLFAAPEDRASSASNKRAGPAG